MTLIEVQSEFLLQATRERNAKIEEYLKNNLKSIGFEFGNQNDFYEFLKERVHRIHLEDTSENELRLDYVDSENTGTLIGVYSDKVSFSEKEGIFTATIE